MRLIVDSGSTTDWIAIDDNGKSVVYNSDFRTKS
jgi:hypothetical protein